MREIEAMPMQYYSLLAEAAMDISGGQKQRLLIARAIYHQPKALFLDEATSSLDQESERLVSQAIQSMRMTRILVAHRKETLATADRVFVLNPPLEVVAQAESGRMKGGSLRPIAHGGARFEAQEQRFDAQEHHAHVRSTRDAEGPYANPQRSGERSTSASRDDVCDDTLISFRSARHPVMK